MRTIFGETIRNVKDLNKKSFKIPGFHHGNKCHQCKSYKNNQCSYFPQSNNWDRNLDACKLFN